MPNVYFSLNLVIVMDARRMSFDTGSFDVIIDKGTLDSFMVIIKVKIVWGFLRRECRINIKGGVSCIKSDGNLYLYLIWIPTIPWIIFQKRRTELEVIMGESGETYYKLEFERWSTKSKKLPFHIYSQENAS